MRVAVVVGASSGIGLATAIQLAEDGYAIVLAARSDAALERAAEQCRAAGADEVRTLATDVRRAADVDRLAELCVAAYGRVDLLVQTAMTMAYGEIERLPSEVFTALVDTGIHGTANLARTFLPVFRRQRSGVYVIVNSLLGSVTVPDLGAYTVAKWGQRAVARTLQQEVRRSPGVHVCIVSPGSANTPIYEQAANYIGRKPKPPFPIAQPEQVAKVIVRLADRPQRQVSFPVGRTNPLIVAGYRLLPRLFDLLAGPLFRLVSLRGREAATEGNVLAPVPERERIRGW